MNFISVFLIGVSLSMDAFSVSVCKGLSMKRINYKHGCVIALFFGVFQALMPAAGFALGKGFEETVEKYAPWIAFILLAAVGGKMMFEAIREKPGENAAAEEKFDPKELFVLAVATSIDAFTVGIVFAADGVSLSGLLVNIAIIGCTTFAISFAGVIIGNIFGSKFNRPAEIAGGAVLIILGIKALAESFI